MVVVTNESYPAHSLLSAYGSRANGQAAMPWHDRSETVHRFSLRCTRQSSRTSENWSSYENFVTPGIEISLVGALSCHVSKFGISTSVLSCACFQVMRLPV
ncbi:MAG: hypothetical protein ACI89X_002313 [Planctomycetota bacterium]|jgi:hypothetical protein